MKIVANPEIFLKFLENYLKNPGKFQKISENFRKSTKFQETVTASYKENASINAYHVRAGNQQQQLKNSVLGPVVV